MDVPHLVLRRCAGVRPGVVGRTCAEELTGPCGQITIGIGNEVRESTVQLSQMVRKTAPSPFLRPFPPPVVPPLHFAPLTH